MKKKTSFSFRNENTRNREKHIKSRWRKMERKTENYFLSVWLVI